MSEDRPVHTDALKTLGTIIDDKQGARCNPYRGRARQLAGAEIWNPASRRRIRSNGMAFANGEKVGIVDPFLERMASATASGSGYWFIHEQLHQLAPCLGAS